MTKDEALRMALVALEMYREYTPEGNGVAERAIKVIEEALGEEALEKLARLSDEIGMDY